MEECPASAVYALSYGYTLNPDEIDRFTDIDRLYIYVFEKTTDECVYMDTQTGPFPSDYRYYLNLFPGEYNIITWGYEWPVNDPSQKMTTVIPDIVVGIWGTSGTGTKIDNARLILEELTSNGKDGLYNTVNKQLENIFYGEMQVKIDDLYSLRNDTVSLINLTNKIRIIFEDVSGTQNNDVSVRIIDKNGAYYFYKSLSDNPVCDASYDKIEYLPCEVSRTGSALIKDFSTLRLFKNDDPWMPDNAYLVFEWVDGSGVTYAEGGDKPSLTISLTELLRKGLEAQGLTYCQRELDKMNRWEIKLDNLNDTYVTGRINVLGWDVWVQTVTGGLNPK
jgi:hypothetical protein